MQKYLEGKTSLEEEKELFNKIPEEEPFSLWKKFRDKNQIKVSKNLLKDITDNLDKTNFSRRKFHRTLTAIAAMISLVILFYLKGHFQYKTDYNVEKITLEEAMGMFENDNRIDNNNVIYEDSMIIIYLDNNLSK